MHDNVLLHGLKFAIGGGAKLDLVDSGRAAAYGAKHLGAVEDEANGLAGHLRGHGGQRNVGPGRAFGAEASAGVGALDTDIVEGDVKGLG